MRVPLVSLSLSAATACSFSAASPDGAPGDSWALADGPSQGDGGDPSDGRFDASPDAAPVTTLHLAVADTFLAIAIPGAGFGSQTSALADADDNECTILLRFDLSSLPQPTTILNAKLVLWTHEDEGRDVEVYPVFEDWDESQATWNSRSNGVAWTAQGARPPSRGTVPLGSVRADESFRRYEIPLNAGILNSGIAHLPKGLAIATSDNDGVRFITRESGTVDATPTLHLTHVP